ncbi:hypothetical protein HOF92_11385 [bacterium]|jgi:hypothetical protein|nr:hypothetical protein [bacterium]
MPNWKDLSGSFRIYNDESWFAAIVVWALLFGLAYLLFFLIRSSVSKEVKDESKKPHLSYKSLSKRILRFMETEELEASEFIRFMENQGIQCAIDMFCWTPSWGWKSITWLRAGDDTQVNRIVRFLKPYIMKVFTAQDPYIRALEKYLEELGIDLEDFEVYPITETDLLLGVPGHLREIMRDGIEAPTRNIPFFLAEYWETVRGTFFLCKRVVEKKRINSVEEQSLTARDQ